MYDRRAVRISFDPFKRARTLRDRGLDFLDVSLVLIGPTVSFPDRRREYGEDRMICVGYLARRMVIVCYTLRGQDLHVISMRKANEREKARFGRQLASPIHTAERPLGED